MKLPALKNATSLSSINGQSIEDYIRASTANLQRVSATMPGSGIAGLLYLGFDGTTGEYKLSKEVVDPKSLGRILIPQHGLFEGCIEWANGTPLQKIQRQLLGVHYDEPMSEKLLLKPLSPHVYRKDNDGPNGTLGFIGYMLDDGGNVMFEHSSAGSRKAIQALATTATQAVAAFGEIVHPVIELLGASDYENSHGRKIYDPKLNVVGYVTDKRVLEVDVITDADIITRPMTTSKAKLRRGGHEAPAL